MKIIRIKVKYFLFSLFFALVFLIPWNGDYFLTKIFADDIQEIFEEKIVWRLSDSPIVIDHKDYYFKEGLEIEKGVKVFLKNNSNIIVNDELEITGSLDKPVIFKGMKEGDNNFSISVIDSSRVYINNAVFTGGGYNQCMASDDNSFFKKTLAFYLGDCLTSAALSINNSQNISINNSTFNENYKAINIIDSNNVLLTNNSFHHNDKMAIYSETESPVIAKSNCWMRPSGPQHESNPEGRGEKIVGNFDLDFQRCGSEFQPVILIPGIGGSWSWMGMFSENSFGDWDFNPFIDHYNAWEDSLKDLDYKKNRDYFVVAYDWRDDNRESLENYLLPILEKIEETSFDKKFNIIAHSMGGFMTLDYITGSDYQNDINKVVLQGSPLLGSSKVYSAWEGGSVPEGWKDMERYLWILSRKDENEGLDYYDLIHKYIPSAKQLMPIYNYIEKNDGGDIVNFWEMEEQNDYLMDLMQQIGKNENNFDYDNVLMIQGSGHKTSQIIKVDDYDGEDSDKLWKDGKPNPYPLEKKTDLGDGTVLNMSSSGVPVFNAVTLEGVNHSDLPAKAVEETGKFLGINFEDKEYPESIKDKLLFIFACPIDVKIKDSLGNYISEDVSQIDGAYYYSDGKKDGYKIIEIQNPNSDEYLIEIEGNGNGKYDAIIYKYFEDGNVYSEFEGEIKKGEIISYDINSNDEEIVVDKKTESLAESGNDLSFVGENGSDNNEEENDDEDEDDKNEDDEDEDNEKDEESETFLTGAEITKESFNNQVAVGDDKIQETNIKKIKSKKENPQIAGDQARQNISFGKIILLVVFLVSALIPALWSRKIITK